MRRPIALLAAGLLLTPQTVSAADVERADSTGSVSSLGTTKAEIRAAYLNKLRPTLRNERLLRARGCDVDPMPLATQRRTIRAVNFMRRLSGLDPVVLDRTMSRKAQKAALIQHHQGFLSHTPSQSARCSTRAGREASAGSNLAVGYEGARAILAYLDDGGGNTHVGHRRWILDPFIESMGTGQVGRYHALYLVEHFSQANTVPARFSWPTAGFFPAQLEPHGRWSFSMVGSDVSFTDARVSVTRRGRTLALRHYRPASGYGDQVTLVWDLQRRIRIDDGTKRFQVTITGIQQGGVELSPYTYEVRLFRA